MELRIAFNTIKCFLVNLPSSAAKVRIDKLALSELENLKYIIVAATGYNNIDIDSAISELIEQS